LSGIFFIHTINKMVNMKTMYHSEGSLATRVLAFVVLTAILAVMSCKDYNNDDYTTSMAPYTISGNASGAQSVPPVAGNGTATLTGSYDPSTRELTYSTNWSGLSGPPISGGFYAGNAATVDSTGAPIGSRWTFDSTATATGSMNAKMTLTPDQATALSAGSWYYIYATKAHPHGEIRGQITAAQAPGTPGNTNPY
jgi:hypothetical protein